MSRSVVVALCLVGGTAAANPIDLALIDEGTTLRLDDEWPVPASDSALSMEDRITDHVTEWGNHAGYHVDSATRGYVGFRVDARHNRANLHLGGGNEHLRVDFDTSWLFANGKAYVKATLAVDLASHHFELALPDVDFSRDSVRNEGVTEVNVSVLEKRF